MASNIMYLEYFGLKEQPFSIAPDPRYLYMSERHREALAHLLYGVNGQGGFVVLTGEVGTGKTTICRCFLHQVPKNTDIAYVVNPKLSARELLATICDEYKIDYAESASIKTLNDHINTYLLDAHAEGRHTVLIIDEAQNLRVDVLEQLRLLTNLETSEKKLLQIILLGQPELRAKLAQNELRQLNQRVTARYHLQELNRVEVGAYLQCRLAVAGRKRRLFSMGAVNRLFKISGGIPRLINLIADRALLGAYATQSEEVDKSHIGQAYREIQGEQPRHLATWLPWSVSAVLVMSAMILGLVFWEDKIWPGSAAEQSVTVVEPDALMGLVEREIDTRAGDDGDGALLVAANSSAPNPLTTQESPPQEHPTIEEFQEALSSSAQTLMVHAEAESPDVTAMRRMDDSGVLATLGQLSPSRTGKLKAFQAVFERWNINYIEEPFSLACNFAELQGLRCLHKQGNWRSLLRLNRPAVLTLFNQDGEEFYLALLRIREDRGEVEHEGRRFWVTLDEVDRYWLGEYSVLWRLPPYKSQRVSPGQLNEEQWLSTHLDRLLAETQHAQGGASLSDKLRAFQRQVGLVPDGIAGSMTIIHMNNMLGSNCPTLMGKG